MSGLKRGDTIYFPQDCWICCVEMYTKWEMYEHLYSEHNSQTWFHCPQCPKLSASAKARDFHVGQTHSEPSDPVTSPAAPAVPAGRLCRSPPVPGSAARPRRLQEAKKSKVSRTQTSPAHCDICGKSVLSRNLKRHKASKHSDKTVPCEVEDCKTKFCEYRPDEVKAHMENVHRGVLFFCSNCQSKFTRKSNMINHTKACHGKNK